MQGPAPVFIHVIADYGSTGDMAFAEVCQALRYEMRDRAAFIDASNVPAFDTVATGFMLAQLALNHRMGDRQFFYVNTAPRKDDKKARANNAGEHLVYAKLKNGVQIVAVDSGYSLSFIRDHVDMLRIIQCDTDGSQFRSRDVFPAAFGLIVHGDFSQLGGDIAAQIPDMPQSVICYRDGYGNMKTTIDAACLDGIHDKKVDVTINGVTRPAHIGKGIFSVPDGEMVLSAGSSGWIRADGTKMRFVECVLRGGSAAAQFNNPENGSTITWK